MLNIRKAIMEDLDAITAVEAVCFPQAEAAPRESFAKRLCAFSDYFWLLEDDDRLVGFVNGMATNLEHLTDEMFANADMHDPAGCWQMIFGVVTIPEYRRQGCAEMILNRVIAETKEAGKKGLVLTCKDHMLHYYSKFGFVNEGVSESEHGGALWYEMRLTF